MDQPAETPGIAPQPTSASAFTIPSPSYNDQPDFRLHEHNPQNPFNTPFYRVVTDGARRAGRVAIEKSSKEIESEMPLGTSIHSRISLHKFPLGEVSIDTDIGGRKAQEDRVTFCPALGGRPNCMFMGVFDGTVGDFASENVQHFVVPRLLTNASWQQVLNVLDQGADLKETNTQYLALFPALANALDDMYLWADSELISNCALHEQHYASSTSVVAVIVGNCCGVGHLGDSRAALGHFSNRKLYGTFVTDDHKPNLIHERNRIRLSGGSVEYLHNHNNKPFIRGGDFSARKARGEQPMQLQYSRAFGGKDLKMYGLSNEPDVLCFRIESFHTCLILASDGLWDVLSALTAVTIAILARLKNQDPAQSLVAFALHQQTIRKQSSDNVTAIVHFFKTEENDRLWLDPQFREDITRRLGPANEDDLFKSLIDPN